jgi:two-component system KDP operon response regulator KdpE
MEQTQQSQLVLLANVDEEMRGHVARSLQASCFSLFHVRDIEQLLAEEAIRQPGVILFDESLPELRTAVQIVREASSVPLVLLSLAQDPMAAVSLREGADAVLMKPFSAELLIATIESVLRRARPSESRHARYRCTDLVIDFPAKSVVLGTERVHLSVREYRLLQVLATNGGRVLTHDDILRLVWGPGYEASGDLLRGYIRNLRRKLGDDTRSPHYVYTENQVGYWMPRSEDW